MPRRPAVKPRQLARALSKEVSIVYRWINRGYLTTFNLRGYHKSGKFIRRSDAVSLIHDWKRTCTPTEAAVVLGIEQDSIWHFIKDGIRGVKLETMKLCGLTRVVKSSIDLVEKQVGRDIRYPDRKGFARYSREQLSEGAKEVIRSGKHYKLTREDRQKGARRMNKTLAEQGRAHRWTSEEAKEVSKKGVEARLKKLEARRSVAQ